MLIKRVQPLLPIAMAPKDGAWVILIGKTNDEPAAIGAFWYEAEAGEDDSGWYDSESAGNPVTCFGFEPTHFLQVDWPCEGDK